MNTTVEIREDGTIIKDGVVYEPQKPPVPKVYRPQPTGTYWRVDTLGEIANAVWGGNGNDFDRHQYSIGNCFATKAEAEHHLKTKIRQQQIMVELERYIVEHDMVYAPDWEVEDPIAHYVARNSARWTTSKWHRGVLGIPFYFANMLVATTFISDNTALLDEWWAIQNGEVGK